MKFEPQSKNLRYPKFGGVFTALVTPFPTNQKHTLDRDATSELIEFLLNRGIDGLFIFGSTGEGPLLDNYKDVYGEFHDVLPSDTPTIVQTSRKTLDQTIEFTSQVAKHDKADAVAVMPPHFYTMDQERLRKYFEEVLDSARDIPIFLYDIPQFTGNNISPTILTSLAKEHDNLAGIKSSTPNFAKLAELINLSSKFNLSVFVGNDQFIYPGLCFGAQGIVSGPANALPEPYVELYKYVRNRHLDKAIQVQHFINDFIQSVIIDGSHISRIKQAINSRDIRLKDFSLSFPRAIDRETQKSIKKEMRAFTKKINDGGDIF